MRIAAVQHRLRSTTAEDVSALVDAVRVAGERGAEFVVVPCVPGLTGQAVRVGISAAVRELGLPYVMLALTCESPGDWCVADGLDGAEPLGTAAMMAGDACFDTSAWARAAQQAPRVALLSPLSESDLQAEAALEIAIGLSDSLCGLVIVAECAGAESGEPGHGGSAIILLGEVLAEALGEEDVLVVDVMVPVPQPEPPAPPPEIPPILAQRVALHAGFKLEVGYLADLSDGSGDR